MRNLSIWVAPMSRVYNLTEPLDKAIMDAYQRNKERCFVTFSGAFAVVLWNGSKKQGILARDRYGIKQLYYVIKDGKLWYGDTIKSLLALGLKPELDLDALVEYFTFQNIYSDRTMFKGIKLLPAGCYAVWDFQGLTVKRYWDYDLTPDLQLSHGDITNELKGLFEQAVSRQARAGGTVGCYLSGGMDSSCIAKYAKDALGHLYTFTCGFDLSSVAGLELAYDEREYAEHMASHIKSEQYEVVLHSGEMELVMPELTEVIEELRVGQCYPNYYASKLAGKFVNTVLSGAGGDELFGGYPWRYANAVGYDYWQRIVPECDRAKLFKPDIYEQIKDVDTKQIFNSVFDGYRGNDNPINRCLYFDLKTFLPALCIVDGKLGVAHGLETRLPFLDNDLVDFVLKIPAEAKVGNLEGKRILRQAMRGVIPDALLNRKKQGFSSPDTSWYRGESMEYVTKTLCVFDARIYEYLSPEYCQKRIGNHLNGKVNERLFIWSLLCFEAWLRRFLPND